MKIEKELKNIKSTLLHTLFPYIFRKRRHIRDYFRLAKNGTITGAADNDPSGIVTYTQIGATTGFALLWLMLLATPFLVAIEDMSARIGIVTKKSLATLIRQKWGFRIALFIGIIVAICNIATIGADLAGMSEVLGVVFGAPWFFFDILLTILLGLFLLKGSYSTISRFLLLLTPIFICYIASGIIVRPEWQEVLRNTFVPFQNLTKDYLLFAVALLGTTISPYLIFWQNTEEVEEKKKVEDLKGESLGVKTGMIYCNLISYFIIIAAAVVLFKQGLSIQTAKDAALALRPLAGEAAFWLFSLGLLGAGFLAVPILASTTAYIFSDIFRWPEGLDKKIWQARGFYAVLILSLFVGWLLVQLGLSPIKMMVYTQVLNGLLMPILLVYLIKIANNSELMGSHTNKAWVNIFGWLAFLVILGFDLVLILNWLR